MVRVNRVLKGLFAFLVLAMLVAVPAMAAPGDTPNLSNGSVVLFQDSSADQVADEQAAGGDRDGEGDPNELGDGWDICDEVFADFMGSVGFDSFNFEQCVTIILFQIWAQP